MNTKYWFMLVVPTGLILPPIIDTLISHHKHYPFLWSVLVIPSIFVIYSYPYWRVVIGYGIFSTFLSWIIEFLQYMQLTIEEQWALFWVNAINWCIYVTVGHLKIENEKLLKKVNSLTIVDPLTGAFNRRYFDLQMNKLIPRANETGTTFLVAILDIDRFKGINDTYGHLCGDEALKHIVSVVKENIRDTDTLTRIGGEEFALVLTEVSLEQGKSILERIRKRVELSELSYKGKPVLSMTISAGLTEYKDGSLEELMKKADEALYEAKTQGRNTIVVL